MRSLAELSRLAAALGGLPVLGCLDGSPAAEAGMRYGDILLALDDTPVSSWDDFIQARSQRRDGFRARIFRDGEELTLAIVLRPASAQPAPAAILGQLLERKLVPSGGLDDDGDVN